MSEGRLVQVGERTLVQEDIFFEEFVCDLEKCKGICCVKGDSGAPLLQEETAILEEIFPKIRHRLSAEEVQTILQEGAFVKDQDGDLTTPCIDRCKECVYVVPQGSGVACAIELAHQAGEITYLKPISCHLYPIRITSYPDFDALYYDRWSICADACVLGQKEKVAVYQFLKAPLIRKYGEAWYQELTETAQAIVKKR